MFGHVRHDEQVHQTINSISGLFVWKTTLNTVEKFAIYRVTRLLYGTLAVILRQSSQYRITRKQFESAAFDIWEKQVWEHSAPEI